MVAGGVAGTTGVVAGASTGGVTVVAAGGVTGTGTMTSDFGKVVELCVAAGAMNVEFQ